MPSIKVKEPCEKFFDNYCYESLLSSAAYSLPKSDASLKLDQNEAPYDWPEHLKQKIGASLFDQAWNRYPRPYSETTIAALARYANVAPENVIAGPGSNYLLCQLMSLLSQKMPGKMIIARPSFPLYEQHCKINGIEYQAWELNHELEYELERLPEMPDGSVLVFASPNNPVGNTLRSSDLRNILENNPKSIVVADEAYFEFASDPYTGLLAEFSNLILVRTLSKASGLAGLRLGYVVASVGFIEQLRKMILPFLVNSLAISSVDTILNDRDCLAHIIKLVDQVKSERVKLFTALSTLGLKREFQVYESEANFLLLRWSDLNEFGRAQKHLLEHGVQARDVSAGPKLSACLRLSVGDAVANETVLKVFETL